MAADDRTVRLEIYGKVQGVFFRASTRKKAEEWGLGGWVKNRSDGSVKAIVQGPNDVVDRLIEWAHHGPTQARVERVDVSEIDEEEDFQGFEVQR